LTLDLMRSVYAALSSALPALPVRRSWPQIPPAMPGCTFNLLSWQRQEDGSALCLIAVQLRVPVPEDGDTYAAAAALALNGIGFQLISAEDGQEQDTGFFLRSLSFSIPLNLPEPPPVETPMQLRAWVAGAWAYSAAPILLTLKPATRPLRSTASLSQAGDLPPFMPGHIDFGSLSGQAPYLPNDPVFLHLRAAFLAGSEVTLSIRFRSDAWKAVKGHLAAFALSPLGLSFSLSLRALFEP